MEQYEIMDHYLAKLRYHFLSEEIGVLNYTKHKNKDAGEIEMNFVEYIKAKTNNVLYLTYGIFILMVENYHYKIQFKRNTELPIYLLWTLQGAVDKLINNI